MNYVDTPISESLVRSLVNYDIKNSGSSLTPRAGYLGTTVSTPLTLTDINLERAIIVDSRSVVEADGSKNGLILCGNVSDTLLQGTNIYTGTTKLITIQDGVLKPHSTVANSHSYTRAIDTEIHDVHVDNTALSADLVGTFGFNNSYYTFKNASNKSCIEYTSYDTATKTYSWKEVEAKALTPKEAVSWGYNMLSTAPYTFQNSEAVGTVTLLGLMPYSKNGELNLTPIVNQDLTLKCFYAAPKNKKYRVLFEYREPTASVWTQISQKDVDTGDVSQPFTATVSFPIDNVLVKCTVTEAVTGETNPDGSPYYAVLQVMTIGLTLDKEAYGSTANVKPKKYSITKASGLTYRKNRLIAYGVPEDPTILFFSEVNDPGYFPFPNNADILEEPIIHVLPFLENLLVFTHTKLYMYSLLEDGSWTSTLIQNNFRIQPYDLHLIQVVKNMVFFKSGNYYYMVVPKANSVTGELTIAPISKPIESLFDDFFYNVAQSLKTLYNYDGGLSLVRYYNYLDYEDIHNVYVFKTYDGSLVNFTLLYNSVGRYWRIYIIETNTILTPYMQDITKRGTLIGTYIADGKLGIQLVVRDSRDVRDRFANYETRLFKNYQMLDTGYRSHEPEFKKRYREIQFRLHNTSQQKLKFFTEFIVDGDPRFTYEKFLPSLSAEGVIQYQRFYTNALEIPNTTSLGNGVDDDSGWTLDVSEFPETKSWKVRLPVSGKGYEPRLCILSLNDKAYELLSISWVFRTLYSR